MPSNQLNSVGPLFPFYGVEKKGPIDFDSFHHSPTAGTTNAAYDPRCDERGIRTTERVAGGISGGDEYK